MMIIAANAPECSGRSEQIVLGSPVVSPAPVIWWSCQSSPQIKRYECAAILSLTEPSVYAHIVCPDCKIWARCAPSSSGMVMSPTICLKKGGNMSTYSCMLTFCCISQGMLVGGLYGTVTMGWTRGLWSFVEPALLINALVMDIFHFFQHFSGGLIWFGYVIVVALRDVPFNAHKHMDVFVASVHTFKIQ